MSCFVKPGEKVTLAQDVMGATAAAAATAGAAAASVAATLGMCQNTSAC